MGLDVQSVTLRRHPKWSYAKEGNTATAEVVFNDQRVVGLEVATQSNLLYRMDLLGQDFYFGAPFLLLRRLDPGIARDAIEDMAAQGGDWIWLLQAQALLWTVCEACVDSHGRGMASPLLARSTVLSQILEPGVARRVESCSAQPTAEPGVEQVRVTVEGGSSAVFNAATLEALERRMGLERLMYHYGPPMLYLRAGGDAVVERAVQSMAEHGGYALRLCHSLGDLEGAAGEIIRRLGLRV